MLESWLRNNLLLAEHSVLSRLPAAPVSSSVPMLIGLGLGALVVMTLLVALLQYRQRRGVRSGQNSPTDLWAELCRVHQLEKNDSAALRELSEARRMEPAASVFVRADLWQLERETPELRHLRPQLQRLYGILFAGSELQHKIVRL